MTTDKRQFTMRMQPENFDKLKVISALNKRSMAMQIEYLLEQYIAEYEATHGQIFKNENNGSVVQNNGGNNYGMVGGNFNSGVTVL